MRDILNRFRPYRRFMLRFYERRYWNMSTRLFLACWEAGMVINEPDRMHWAKLAKMEYGRECRL